MTDPIELRKRIRLILSALPEGRRASEDLLFSKSKSDFPDLRLDELRHAIEWNQARGFVDYRRNHDEERDEWFLTERGRQKEGLA
jgi:hemerythrin superfamily protein